MMEKVRMASLPGSSYAMVGKECIFKSRFEGKTVAIEWPDGTVTKQRLNFKTMNGCDYDHGHEYPTKYDEAFFIFSINGLRVDFRLDSRFRMDIPDAD